MKYDAEDYVYAFFGLCALIVVLCCTILILLGTGYLIKELFT